MSKNKILQLIAIILIFIIDTAIAYFITCSFGIQNTVLLHSYTATAGDITYEVLLLWLFLLLEAPFINKFEAAIE